MSSSQQTRYHRLRPSHESDNTESSIEKDTACAPPSDTAGDEVTWDRSDGWSFKSKLLLLLSIFLGTYAVITTAMYIGWRNVESITAHRERLSDLRCGNSSQEARARGCKFDVLTYHWIPRECFDETTANEFVDWLNSTNRNFGRWPFFKDIYGKEQVCTLDELSDRYDTMTYSTREEHLGHCVFMLRRLRRAANDDGQLISAPSMPHVEHCQEALIGGFSDVDLVNEKEAQARGEKLGAIFKIRFGHCYEI